MAKHHTITRPRQVIKAQPGPQTAFLASPADIVFFGGGAGGGKSYGLLLDAGVQASRFRNYGAVIFRRTCKQVIKPGCLWDTSELIYPLIGGRATKGNLLWRFPDTGSTINFDHLEHENNKEDWQGSQIAYVAFDEVTHFTEGQFWYLTSRNRADTEGPIIVRATCNPQSSGWVKNMVAWWIDPLTGYPIPERSGVIRWFCRIGDSIVWADKASELKARYGNDVQPMSFTFIQSKLTDNPILERTNPRYRTTLLNLPAYEKEQLLNGNWNVLPAAGGYFRRDKFGIPVKEYPKGFRTVRCWDRAASLVTAQNDDPDYTAGVKMTTNGNGTYYVVDVIWDRFDPQGLEEVIMQTAVMDGIDTEICFGQDPASAGKIEADLYIRMLAGYSVKAIPIHKNKEVIARPFSSQQLAGNVRIVEGYWNESFVNELVNFPVGGHDDQTDAASSCFSELAGGPLDLSRDGIATGHSRLGTGRTTFKARHL